MWLNHSFVYVLPISQYEYADNYGGYGVKGELAGLCPGRRFAEEW